MAAFTMTTVLLLGLLSAAAIGATRAVVGAPADDPSVEVSAEEAGEDAADDDGTTKPKRATGKASTTKKGAKTAKGTRGDKASSKSEPRRAGGAVSPGDALKRHDETHSEEEP